MSSKGLSGRWNQRANVFFFDLEVIDKAGLQRTKQLLQDALTALEAKSKSA